MDAPHVEIQTPKGTKKVSLGQIPLTVGRSAGNLIVLDDTQASRAHCVIERSGGGWRVRDLDSRNGTRLNGREVKAAELNPGDVVTIGNTRIKMIAPARVVGGVGVSKPEEYLDDPLTDELMDFSPPPPPEPEPVRALRFDTVTDDAGADIAEDEYDKHLLRVAESLPEKAFGMMDIALMNTRGKITHPAKQAGEDGEPGSAADPVGALRVILLICFRTRASDIHIEPKNNNFHVRIRVDGTMVDVVKFDKEFGIRLVSLVKVLGEIDITQRNTIQEGHFSVRVPGRRVDFRVSFAPSMLGQKVVMRILDAASAPLHISDLQLPKWMFDEISRAVDGESGMILTCGPTGSGKTTTLYAAVRDIDLNQRNVITIEDPVEIELEGVTQIPVNADQGSTFPNLLRSVLRQDPDAILVGEIRDAETARIAMQAAMTGHLVFSTVHSRDTIGTIFRMLDLGVEPFLVASGMHLVLAQRLVRQLCPYCKRPVRPTQEQLQKMGPAAAGVTQIFIQGGCPKCLRTGYFGRRAIFELLKINDAVRDVILAEPNMQTILNALQGTKFMRLNQTGYQLVAGGITTFDEIDRVVGG